MVDEQSCAALPPVTAFCDAGKEYRPSLRVLVVDDHPECAEATAVLLQFLGHTTRTAETGSRALQIAEDWRPHLALVDFALPDMDGEQVAARLKADCESNGVVIVGLSGHTDPALQQRWREAGCDAVLSKPLPFDRLLAKLEALQQSIALRASMLLS